MERVIERGCGLDVHKKTVTACVRIPGPRGEREQHVRTFGTTAADLLILRDWLEAYGVTHIAMESTGVYWKPIFYVLEEAFTCVSRGGVLRRQSARDHARRLVDAFRIQASLDTPVCALSGGNQQRLLVAREAAQEPKALVALHPTAGLDVASTESVHRILLELRARGVAVLLISEHLDEVLALADRVLVMYRGRIVHERPAGRADVAEIGLHMTGVGERP